MYGTDSDMNIDETIEILKIIPHEVSIDFIPKLLRTLVRNNDLQGIKSIVMDTTVNILITKYELTRNIQFEDLLYKSDVKSIVSNILRSIQSCNNKIDVRPQSDHDHFYNHKTDLEVRDLILSLLELGSFQYTFVMKEFIFFFNTNLFPYTTAMLVHNYSFLIDDTICKSKIHPYLLCYKNEILRNYVERNIHGRCITYHDHDYVRDYDPNPQLMSFLNGNIINRIFSFTNYNYVY
ncbi:hypothetical protein D3C87_998420 [compost metagenome]